MLPRRRAPRRGIATTARDDRAHPAHPRAPGDRLHAQRRRRRARRARRRRRHLRVRALAARRRARARRREARRAHRPARADRATQDACAAGRCLFIASPAPRDDVIPPGGGEVIGDSPDRRVEILSDHDALNATLSRFGPGREGADLHVHRHHSDLFYVLEGELTVRLGVEDRAGVVPAGSVARVPPDVVHGFRNASDADLRYLNFHAPGRGSPTTCAGCATAPRSPTTSTTRPRTAAARRARRRSGCRRCDIDALRSPRSGASRTRTVHAHDDRGVALRARGRGRLTLDGDRLLAPAGMGAGPARRPARARLPGAGALSEPLRPYCRAVPIASRLMSMASKRVSFHDAVLADLSSS